MVAFCCVCAHGPWNFHTNHENHSFIYKLFTQHKPLSFLLASMYWETEKQKNKSKWTAQLWATTRASITCHSHTKWIMQRSWAKIAVRAAFHWCAMPCYANDSHRSNTAGTGLKQPKHLCCAVRAPCQCWKAFCPSKYHRALLRLKTLTADLQFDHKSKCLLPGPKQSSVYCIHFGSVQLSAKLE